MASLKQLLAGVEKVSVPEKDVQIKGIATDSREVKEGDLFICLVGGRTDGHDYVLEAQMLGAAAIVAEHDVDSGLPVAKVTNSRRAYSKICQNFFNNPLSAMKFVAVIGTNGKTSTTYIIDHILTEAGYKTGVIGTLGYKILDKTYEAELTTPDPLPLNKLFFKMKQAGVEIVIAEVSAHAIALEKLWGIKADVSIFTNLTQDHLDFFGDFDSYARTKMSFFTPEHTRATIVNADDKYGRQIVKNAKIPVVTYGILEPSDVFAIDIAHTDKGVSFIINLLDEIYEVGCPLFGRHNVYNVLAAATLAKMMSICTPQICLALQNMPEIEGRFNIFLHKKGKVVVDFAHTPDGLENLLKAAREMCGGRLITVFGCGGNRDAKKRPVMGDIAGRMSDVIVLTSDNPRFEEPMEIIAQIEPSARAVNNEVYVIENRKSAIRFAMGLAREGDITVIAGKGGEKYTEIRGKKIKYSDISEVKAAVRGES